MTEIHYPGSSLASKVYTCETFSTTKKVEDWTEPLKLVPEDVLFKVHLKETVVPHEQWVEQVRVYMKKHKKGFDIAEKKVPKTLQQTFLCLKSRKIKGYLTIDTIDGKDVPFNEIDALIFNDIKYTLTQTK